MPQWITRNPAVLGNNDMRPVASHRFAVCAAHVLACGIIITLLSGCCSRNQEFENLGARPTQTCVNPVLPNGADPTVLLYNGTYYLYATGNNKSYIVHTSADLVHWEKGPEVFRPGQDNVWAPDVYHCKKDGKFYLYYTAGLHLGVAVGDKPVGPFVDQGILVHRAIDPHVFEDDDGQCYLYFSGGAWIYVEAMASPTQLKGNRKGVLQATEPWEKLGGSINEGPWMIKRKGTYYLLYSGGAAASRHYAVGYATAKSPMGPFTKYSGNPIIQGSETVFGPGHGSVTQDAAGNLWHVYHQKKGAGDSWVRDICIDPLWFDSDGVLHGKATRGTHEPAPRYTPKTEQKQ